MKTMGLITALLFVVGLTGALAQFPLGGFGETRYVDANTRQVVLSVGFFINNLETGNLRMFTMFLL